MQEKKRGHEKRFLILDEGYIELFLGNDLMVFFLNLAKSWQLVKLAVEYIIEDILLNP